VSLDKRLSALEASRPALRAVVVRWPGVPGVARDPDTGETLDPAALEGRAVTIIEVVEVDHPVRGGR